MTHFRTPLLATAVLTAAFVMVRPSAAQDLAVTFEGIKTPTGAIMVALFDSEAAFDGADGRPLRSVAIPNGLVAILPSPSTSWNDLMP